MKKIFICNLGIIIMIFLSACASKLEYTDNISDNYDLENISSLKNVLIENGHFRKISNEEPILLLLLLKNNIIDKMFALPFNTTFAYFYLGLNDYILMEERNILNEKQLFFTRLSNSFKNYNIESSSIKLNSDFYNISDSKILLSIKYKDKSKLLVVKLVN